MDRDVSLSTWAAAVDDMAGGRGASLLAALAAVGHTAVCTAGASSAVAAGARARRGMRDVAPRTRGVPAVSGAALKVVCPSRVRQASGVQVQHRILWLRDSSIQLPGACLRRQGASVALQGRNRGRVDNFGLACYRAHAYAARTGCAACRPPAEVSAPRKRSSSVSCPPVRPRVCACPAGEQGRQ